MQLRANNDPKVIGTQYVSVDHRVMFRHYTWTKLDNAESRRRTIWKNIIDLISETDIGGLFTQEYHKRVFEIFTPPGMIDAHEAKQGLGLRTPIAVGELTTLPKILKILQYFTALSVRESKRIIKGYKNPEALEIKPEEMNDPLNIIPIKPDYLKADDFYFKKASLLMVFILLDHLHASTGQMELSFLKENVIMGINGTDFQLNAGKIYYFGNRFYISNEDCQLLQIYPDSPETFIDCYLLMLMILDDNVSRRILINFPYTHSEKKE
jgi:hypothetical protein